MKVTEDMITRAIEAMEVGEPNNLRTAIDDVLRRKYVRVALEAALADLPEPDELASAAATARRDVGFLDLRVLDAEAAISRVRGELTKARKLTPEVNAFHADIARALDGHREARPSRVVSEPGAGIKVTALELTPAEQEALSTGGARIPASGDAPSILPKFLFSQRDAARKAAVAAHERWHAGEGWVRRPVEQGGDFLVDYWAYVVNAAIEALPGRRSKEGR